ncbi:MAG: aminoacyl-tRNA hydrolase [Candidatus Levybacteria bacterium]|nr:aminoacyl-tRNA hydrolase [Candidatus Levybacteria bacterium]
MKLIVGLGNPGKKYEDTRHNLGFMVVDELVQSFLRSRISLRETKFKIEEKFKAEILELKYSNEKIIISKPLTYMNNSGMAISLLVNFYKINSEDIWIIHDDVDLLLGSMKIRFGGASAGHKGVESIIKNLGTDKFWRFRIGIASKRSEIGIKTISGERMKIKNIDDFVLGEFIKEELHRVKEEVGRAANAVSSALEFGLEYTQQKFNKK